MKPFLCARWQNLINISYAIKPDILLPFLPRGIEPDVIGGRAFVSLVPFQFESVRLFGCRVPFHGSFPEMNLRACVHFGDKPGVVFIREFVPHTMVSFIANRFYDEHYETNALRAEVKDQKCEISVCYSLKKEHVSHTIQAKAFKTVFKPSPCSQEYFFENRFFGFSADGKGVTSSFEVVHPEWELYSLYDYSVDINFSSLFGERWSFLNHQEPVCAMLIKGSEVQMMPFQKRRAQNTSWNEKFESRALLSSELIHK